MAENHQVFLFGLLYNVRERRWKSGGLPLSADRNEV